MEVYHALSNYENTTGAVVTIGTFDGVHIGHQKIISRLTEVADSQQLKSVVLTFWPHPRQILRPKDPPIPLLFSLDEKLKAFEMLKVQHVVVLPFNVALATHSAMEFTQKVLAEALHTRHLIIGYDHHFGHNREGNLDFLKIHGPSFGFEVEEIAAQDIDDIAVSSSKIRTALLEGNIPLANSFIGAPYQLHATVIAGAQLGRTLGYPTANLQVLEPLKLLPKRGVYVVKAMYDLMAYPAMMNIGTKPTVGAKEITLEVHILGFNQDIYGKELQIQFYGRLRDEVSFGSLEELKRQLAIDRKRTEDFFQKIGS
jgi:riboflavin kinase/FMN adenylyltransferase